MNNVYSLNHTDQSHIGRRKNLEKGHIASMRL